MRKPTQQVPATQEVEATPQPGEATPEQGAGATSGAGTPWAAVATSVADTSAAGISLPRAGTSPVPRADVSPVPRAGTIMPGLTSPAPLARRPLTRPRTDVSRAPARCTRPLATRAAEVSYPAGTAGTPGAVATGTAPSGRTVISTPVLPGSCRYFRSAMPRSGGADCLTTTGITSITPGARATTAMS